jgi:probable F420-dependent oxidoreductase
MRIGIHVPVFGPLANAENILGVAKRAEALGFDSLWSSDHVVMPARVASRYPYSPTGEFLVPTDATWFDPFMPLAAIASVTTRVRLGTSVVIVPYRNPLVLAKMVASLDRLCHGRLILGCGAGWMKEEFDALGVPFQERGARMDESLDIMRILWREGAGTFQGRFYRFADMHLTPKPVQTPHPPIWIAGSSDAALRRTLRRGDGWHPTRVGPEDFRARVATLRDMAAREGKELGRLALCPKTSYDRCKDLDTFMAFKAAGATDLLIDFLAGTLDDVYRGLEAMARDILPTVRGQENAQWPMSR